MQFHFFRLRLFLSFVFYLAVANFMFYIIAAGHFFCNLQLQACFFSTLRFSFPGIFCCFDLLHVIVFQFT